MRLWWHQWLRACFDITNAFVVGIYVNLLRPSQKMKALIQS